MNVKFSANRFRGVFDHTLKCVFNDFGVVQGQRRNTCETLRGLDVSGVPYHANCTRPIPSQRLHQIEQSPVDKEGLWINDVVSILVHVHPSDTIGNETRQTRQLVSSQQQSNGSVVGPRRGVKLCDVQLATVHEWAFGCESPY
ncbi:hypothetical protein AVEN_51430-1 [Araneus ventricosus]|uniref:Uncharacterized protein n=1 Tax=Araneus ventricosus TaxID=182803 RepID=A0A4Y2GGI2_ARAVE|nr:hypothetical protein AVEN_51430-1 [Araneus ventricosus]